MSETFDWDDIAKKKLGDLWAEGHPTSEIGRRFGISKNAIVGKAHRLGLPARPSPVRRSVHNAGTPPKPVPRAKRVPALSLLMADAVPEQAATAITAPPATKQARAAPPPARRSFVAREAAQCCWPMGEPGTRSFRYCDEPTSGRGSYCTDHADVAYVRRQPRSNAAAMPPVE